MEFHRISQETRIPSGAASAQTGLQTSGLDAVLDYEGNRKKPFAIALVIA